MARRLNCALDWENAGYAPSGVHLLSYPHKSALSSESSAAAMGLDPTTCSDFAHSSSICSRGAQSIYSWFFLLCHALLLRVYVEKGKAWKPCPNDGDV
jgi:hypothetical protein